MAEDSYIDVARQRRTVNKLKALIDEKADASSVPKAYTLPIASESILGGVKGGGNVSIASDGTMSTPEYATKDYVDSSVKEAGSYTLPAATTTKLGGVKVGDNLSVTTDGTLSATDTKYSLPVATKTTLGGVKVGNNLSVTADGTVSATDTKYTLPVATKTKLGGVMPDDATVATTSTGVLSVKDGGITSAKIADGAITSDKLAGGSTYTLPVASKTTLGGIKVGSGLSISDDGTLSNTSINPTTWTDFAEISSTLTSSNKSDFYNKWRSKIGTILAIDLAGYGTINFKLVGIAADKDTSGNPVGFTWCANSVITTHKMNPYSTTSGGWEKSNMRNWLSSTLLETFTDDIKSAIKTVVKSNTSNYGAASTSDKLWLFSYTEVGLGGDEGATYEGFTDNASRVRANGSSASNWWLRSVYSSSVFRDVSSDGSLNDGNYAYVEYGVVPGFCI